MLKSFFWSLMEQGGSSVVSLVVQIVLARLLAPEMFGVMAILLVFINVASALVQSGLGAALIQADGVTATSYSTVFWLSMAFALVLYALIFATAPLIASLYGMPDLDLYLRVLALVLFVDAFNSVQRSHLQKDMNFKALFKSTACSVLVGGAAGIAAAVAGWGIWALVLQMVVQMIVSCVAMLVQVPWRPSFAFNSREARAFFGFGWKICVTGILNTLYTGVSELILGKTCSAADLGFYSQGRKWPVAAMSAFCNALQNVMFPAFAEIKNDQAAFQSAVKKALVTGSYAVIPACLLTAVIAEPVVALLLTEKWLPCVLIFQLACVSYALAMPQVVNLRAYMALGDSGLYLKLQIVKVVSGIILIGGTAFAVRDIYWVAAMVAFHSVFSIVVIDMHPAKRMHGIGRAEQLKDLLPIVGMSVIAALVSYAVSFAGLSYPVEMLAEIACYLFVYLVGSRLLRIPGFEECFMIVKELVGRR